VVINHDWVRQEQWGSALEVRKCASAEFKDFLQLLWVVCEGRAVAIRKYNRGKEMSNKASGAVNPLTGHYVM
jgi:hypothetical protein